MKCYPSKLNFAFYQPTIPLGEKLTMVENNKL